MSEENGKNVAQILIDTLSDCVGTGKGGATLSGGGEYLEETCNVVTSLINALGENNQEGVENALAKLSGHSDSELFDNVGKLTRKLHSSLVEFRKDVSPRLNKLVESGMPEAADQLQSVILMTDKAAHTVFEIVDKQAALLQESEKSVKAIKACFEEACSEGTKDQAFEELRKLTDTVLETNKSLVGLNTDIVMAQEFQDLTGQIVRKVITLITEVETNLVSMLTMFGIGEQVTEQAAENTQGSDDSSELKGPAVDGSGCSQDDVDSLLDSLGF